MWLRTGAELEFEQFVIHRIHFLHCSDPLAPCVELSCHGHVSILEGEVLPCIVCIGVSKGSGLTNISFPVPSRYDQGNGGSQTQEILASRVQSCLSSLVLTRSGQVWEAFLELFELVCQWVSCLS